VELADALVDEQLADVVVWDHGSKAVGNE